MLFYFLVKRTLPLRYGVLVYHTCETYEKSFHTFFACVSGPESEYLFSLQGEGHLKILDSFIQNALVFMKEKNLIKSHSLPQIRITDELVSHKVLSFPGKVTAFSSAESNLLAIGDTGHNRVIVTDNRGLIKVFKTCYLN